jgi:hypothetical protein
MQPIGHLCDLLGVSRHSPGVFDAMVDLLYGGEAGGDAAREARLTNLGDRLTRRR